jgi:iron complex outermembrane receptor protein
MTANGQELPAAGAQTESKQEAVPPVPAAAPPAETQQDPASDETPLATGEDLDAELSELSELEALLQAPAVAPALAVEVTTVTRQKSTVGRSPAAVFVVSQDMIRRSGATSVPEVLRSVPGLQVVRIDSNKWSVTSRGFADRFFNRFLLVQIDGRAVYQVINSTVSWDATDVMLEDVERIEVIRGPGASVWGANAVNGIINIITKDTADTQGGLISSGGGTEERGFTSFRYGGGNGADLNYRVYGKWFERDNGFNANGDAQDDWRSGRGGIRMDWQPTEDDSIMLQGEIFEVNSGRRDFLRPLTTTPFFFTNTEDEITEGGHLLSRWTHDLGDDSGWTLQMYYDRYDRRSTNQIINASIDTYDIDFQHHFPL